MGDWLVPSAVRARAPVPSPRPCPASSGTPSSRRAAARRSRVACKLARATTGRTGIVSAEHGYHGHVGFALAMDEARDSEWFAPLVPGITKVPFADIAAVERAVTDETAAVCMETVPATAGYLVPPDDYWPRGPGAVRRAGRAADPRRGPVRAGTDRDGSGRASAGTSRPTCWWPARGSRGASTRSPPARSATASTRSSPGTPSSTRRASAAPSSAPRSSRRSSAKVTEPGFLDHVEDMGARLAAGFDRLCAAHPGLLVGHRGLGLMRALDTVSPEACYRLMLEAIDGGLLVVWANNKQETLLVMPPLVVEADEVDEILQVLDRAAARVGAP